MPIKTVKLMFMGPNQAEFLGCVSCPSSVMESRFKLSPKQPSSECKKAGWDLLSVFSPVPQHRTLQPGLMLHSGSWSKVSGFWHISYWERMARSEDRWCKTESSGMFRFSEVPLPKNECGKQPYCIGKIQLSSSHGRISVWWINYFCPKLYWSK